MRRFPGRDEQPPNACSPGMLTICPAPVKQPTPRHHPDLRRRIDVPAAPGRHLHPHRPGEECHQQHSRSPEQNARH